MNYFVLSLIDVGSPTIKCIFSCSELNKLFYILKLILYKQNITLSHATSLSCVH